MDKITKNEKQFEESLDLREIIGVKVISKSGIIIGKVKKIKLDSEKMKVMGVVVKRSHFSKVYFGEDYFRRLSNEAIMLNIDPYFLIIGKEIVSSEGKKIGKVVSIKRKRSTNEITSIIGRSLIKGSYEIPISQVSQIGHTIILKSTYNVPKKYFFSPSK